MNDVASSLGCLWLKNAICWKFLVGSLHYQSEIQKRMAPGNPFQTQVCSLVVTVWQEWCALFIVWAHKVVVGVVF